MAQLLLCCHRKLCTFSRILAHISFSWVPAWIISNFTFILHRAVWIFFITPSFSHAWFCSLTINPSWLLNTFWWQVRQGMRMFLLINLDRKNSMNITYATFCVLINEKLLYNIIHIISILPKMIWRKSCKILISNNRIWYHPNFIKSTNCFFSYRFDFIRFAFIQVIYQLLFILSKHLLWLKNYNHQWNTLNSGSSCSPVIVLNILYKNRHYDINDLISDAQIKEWKILIVLMLSQHHNNWTKTIN